MSAPKSDWGYMTLGFCDQGRTAHLLLPNGEPACGAKHYASCGAAAPDVPDTSKCRNCLAIESKRAERYRRLVPNGVPRYVRVYDNGGKTADRYTAVFTGRYRHKSEREQLYIGMSSYPFHPQGIGQHGSSPHDIDRPAYAHLGKKIPWGDLPPDCQKCVLQTYEDIWDLKEKTS